MLDDFRKKMAYFVALCWLAGQIYVAFAAVPGMIIRPMHVCFALLLVFMNKPFIKDKPLVSAVVDLSCFAVVLGYMSHVLIQSDRILTRIPFVDELMPFDIIYGILLIILLMEAGRRYLGWSMTIISAIFIAYSFYGKDLPGILAHPPVDLAIFIENQIMTSGGIYSSPIAASSDTIFYFMIFGAFLAATPAGKLFVAMAKYVTRNSVGGAGKASIVASGLFGMISGSAAANVASVGVIAYPMMQKGGFRPVFSAALLATAGTGGQLIPPVMGASAFIMADMIGISYFKIILCAILPAILYVGSLLWEVHLEASKQKIEAPKVNAEELKIVIKSFIHLVLPLVVLVFLIAIGRSLMYAALVSTVVLIALCQIRKDTRLSLKEILKMATDGTKSSVIVTLPCALAGIVIGEVVFTGLGLRFSSVIASLSANSLFLALILSTVMIIIMGMGMPTSAAYIMSAVLLAPAMQNLGVEAIVAHMFIFYFANMSMITPPVAIASYTAAGIAETGLWETGIEAVRLALVLFMIPFVFVYNPALLGIGSIPDIAWVFFTCAMGIVGLGIGVIGYWKTNLSVPMRIAYVVAALLLIVPEITTDIIGLVSLFVLMGYKTIKTRFKMGTA
ncbi:MAG: TRAP transporter fused permease subunit [Synergistaceae bacterium]|nr:TRAP transporter fused permease subunit [Synergistaceae bacterium]